MRKVRRFKLSRIWMCNLCGDERNDVGLSVEGVPNGWARPGPRCVCLPCVHALSAAYDPLIGSPSFEIDPS